MLDTEIIVVSLIFLLLILFLLNIYLPISMARRRGRSVLGSLLLFWFTSPLLGIIILLILGDSESEHSEDRYHQYHRD
mgnify:FL=1